MHTLLHFGTDEQNGPYLRGLCEGRMRSCFFSARWARLADGSDEVHLIRIADTVMRAHSETGSMNRPAGGLPV